MAHRSYQSFQLKFKIINNYLKNALIASTITEGVFGI